MNIPKSLEVKRLHIGGIEPREGWKILNIQPGPHVDFVGDCTDLGQFAENSLEEVYASHVMEHLSYQKELPLALRQVHRVLRPGGRFRVSVPDFELLCQLFVHPQLTVQHRFHVMRVTFGGQMDAHDFHKVGLTWEFMSIFLQEAGFSTLRRVDEFGLFDDASALRQFGHLISLNIEAIK